MHGVGVRACLGLQWSQCPRREHECYACSRAIARFGRNISTRQRCHLQRAVGHCAEHVGADECHASHVQRAARPHSPHDEIRQHRWQCASARRVERRRRSSQLLLVLELDIELRSAGAFLGDQDGQYRDAPEHRVAVTRHATHLASRYTAATRNARTTANDRRALQPPGHQLHRCTIGRLDHEPRHSVIVAPTANAVRVSAPGRVGPVGPVPRTAEYVCSSVPYSIRDSIVELILVACERADPQALHPLLARQLCGLLLELSLTARTRGDGGHDQRVADVLLLAAVPNQYESALCTLMRLCTALYTCVISHSVRDVYS